MQPLTARLAQRSVMPAFLRARMHTRRCIARMAMAAATAAVAACASGPVPQATAPGLQVIGVTHIPHATEFLGSTVGGLSGIDYDPVHDRWLLISDDRSTLQPARIYTARLRYTASAMQAPELTGTVTLMHRSGQPFASPRHPVPGMDVPDAEAVRWLPGGQHFLWTSEGDFARGFGPQLRENQADGAAVRDIDLPGSFEPDPTRTSGPRSNATLEGLALSSDGQTAWLAMEAPWIQDGPLPTPQAVGGPLRITAIKVDSGLPLRQIAYVPDAVPRPRRVPWGPQLNGVSEVLADGPYHLLVLERAYSAGAGFSARLYRIDTRAGSDTLALPQLAPGNHQPAPKTLVADFDQLGLAHIDNLEGMAWGPPLPGGQRVIVFVSDDNFNPAQTTQFIAVRYGVPASSP